ncbi:helix-turn-helix transcriptional regulator [Rhodobacteraceae bacterium M385]|nr:helix-turn-helix transcriptional regulator [Rhodobacteraceae bacterium M385]
MRTTSPSSPQDRRLSVQEIRSPLTRSAYFLSAGRAQLLLMYAGEAHLRPTGSQGDTAASGASGARVIWLNDGADRELVVEGGTRGLLAFIPHDAVMRAFPATPLGEHMRDTLAQPLSLGIEDTSKLSGLIGDIREELASGAPGVDLAVDHLLSLLLLRLWRHARSYLVASGSAPQRLAERFMLLASRHARDQWRVADYAKELNVDTDRLRAEIRRSTNLSPKAYLQRELLREACDLLTNTGMTTGQIAFHLGFTDAAYFSRVFSQQMGSPPARYRRDQASALPAEEASFAAWP